MHYKAVISIRNYALLTLTLKLLVLCMLWERRLYYYCLRTHRDSTHCKQISVKIIVKHEIHYQLLTIKMKEKVIIVFFIFFIYVHCAKVNSRQNDSKKDSIRIAKSFRSRGELMENLFIIFDPSFLSYVWPKIKNGVHLNLGHYCWDDVSVFLKDLSEGRAWAYRGRYINI